MTSNLQLTMTLLNLTVLATLAYESHDKLDVFTDVSDRRTLDHFLITF